MTILPWPLMPTVLAAGTWASLWAADPIGKTAEYLGIRSSVRPSLGGGAASVLSASPAPNTRSKHPPSAVCDGSAGSGLLGAGLGSLLVGLACRLAYLGPGVNYRSRHCRRSVTLGKDLQRVKASSSGDEM